MNIDSTNNLVNNSSYTTADRQSVERLQVKLNSPEGSIKPDSANAVMEKPAPSALPVDYEKVNRVRNEYQRKVEWYTDEEGEFRAKVKNGENEVLRYIPPETLDRIMKDLIKSPVGNFVNTVA